MSAGLSVPAFSFPLFNEIIQPFLGVFRVEAKADEFVLIFVGRLQIGLLGYLLERFCKPDCNRRFTGQRPGVIRDVFFEVALPERTWL